MFIFIHYFRSISLSKHSKKHFVVSISYLSPLSSARSQRAPHDMGAARASRPQPSRGNSIDAREINDTSNSSMLLMRDLIKLSSVRILAVVERL